VVRTLQIGPTREIVRGGKRIAIRWHEAKSWSVAIRAAEESQAFSI